MAKKAVIILVLLAVGSIALIWKFHSAEPKTIPPQTPKEICLNNLRLIESGKMQWSLEMHTTFNQSPTWQDLRPYIGRGSNGVMPECPLHGVYSPGTVGETPTCTIHGTIPGPPWL